MTERTFAQILEPFMNRVQVRVGNGLTRSMNQTLRSYPEIPEIIRRTALWLIRAETTFQFSGVHIRSMHLYWDLVQAHDDWGADVPVVQRLHPVEVLRIAEQLAESLGREAVEEIVLVDHPAFAQTVEFKRVPTLPYNRFVAAMAIGRRIGLFCGHGKVGLDDTVRKVVKRSLCLAADRQATAHEGV